MSLTGKVMMPDINEKKDVSNINGRNHSGLDKSGLP
jgi:hypothetical protein